ncbi:hypothetical protein HDIA_1242 [Hartmannibacter diazotrophicus]|uniref:3-oxo-tetronate kinase n=1 Tax=Hartmannibacter diazotrophicus TaxID=1482074 RepID=A0A2C9D3H9_9HYPH|nr:3-oxo-tetronate kinase [Hartmannibacter diazotrophicus]SON54783.1 hypothetical protein HDIA_1242 [Hartmannibacter diazotrophicus]
MTTLLGCIADDFTGATDLAGLLARSGAKVSLRIGVPGEPARPEDCAPFEVIALKCRTAPVDEAIRDCRAALAWLRQAGARRFFWKYCSTFDSTPEGNIGPVAEALMADLGAEQTIYCPAFPENGRSVYMGHLFVGRQLLSESPMKDHPLTPMRDSNLMRLLDPQVEGKVGLADRAVVAAGPTALGGYLAQLRHDGIAHVITDAISDADLETIARACKDMTLVTGGSAIARPLPTLYREDGLLSRDSGEANHPPIAEKAVVLSGSCSAMSRAQVAAYLDRAPGFKLDPLALAKDGTAAARAWLADQPSGRAPLIYATAEPDEVRAAQEALGVGRAGQIVEEALADIAVDAFAHGVRRFVVAGGETSGAVTKALGVSRLAVDAEIAPGVPWTFAEISGEPVALALKSGNFGKETFFTDAFERLDER